MNELVALFGAVITLFGMVGMVDPKKLVGWVQSAWQAPRGFYLTIFIRLTFGALLLSAASESRFPQALRILGMHSLAAAVLIPIIGFARLKRFVDWWAERPTGWVRIWSLGAVGFGVFLVWAGARMVPGAG